MKLLPSRKTCAVLNVHPNTLRKWEKDGKINCVRTPAGQRLYDVDGFIGEHKTKENICYCRVSSHKQKDDLQRQVEYMRAAYPNHRIITDVGSGLSFRRKGLITLLECSCSGTVGDVVVAHKDRLARFGFDLIKWIVTHYGGQLVVLNDISSSPQQELITDLLSIITVFSCRMHGLRKYKTAIKDCKNTHIPDCGPENVT